MGDIEFGIDTFGDLPRNDRGELVSYAEAIRRTVDEAVLADQIGIDAVAVGDCRGRNGVSSVTTTSSD